MFSRRHLPFQIFILAYVVAMFFPRVLPEGMFPDGLTYAAIARNMAEGRGSFWSPYFSSSFWIPFQGSEYQFYGHPPLAMGVLSLFFKLFGDHWFVEKGFNIIVWAISVWLVMRLWMENSKEKALWWLPLYVWYLMPVVLWSYPYFILDNSMAVFSLAATLFILRGVKEIKNEELIIKNSELGIANRSFLILNFKFLIPAGLLLHLAFLAKGPVGLFPLAMPLIYWFFFREKTTIRASILQTGILTLTCFGTLALWIMYEPARFFWTKYFEVQLMSSISVNDQSGDFSWTNYLDLPKNLVLQILPLLGVALIFFVFSKIKKTYLVFEKEAKRWTTFYFIVGLSGSLPMMISHKTGAFYLIPCLPFFALAFAKLFEPTMVSWFEKYKISAQKTQKAVFLMIFVGICVVIYSYFQIGKIAREKDIIQDMKILMEHPDSIGSGAIPDGSKICVCDSMMQDFNYHAYFQRYHRWELAKLTDTTAQFFLNIDGTSRGNREGVCRPSELDSAKQNFIERDKKGLELFHVFQRKKE
jgi:hypothetical protein